MGVNAELDAIAAREGAAGGEGAHSGEHEAEDAAGEETGEEAGPNAADPQLLQLARAFVERVGNVATTRAGVTDLNAQEREAVAQGVANVAAQYDLSRLSPKSAAWIGLGLTVIGIALPRLEEIQARRAAEAQPAPEPDDLPKAA